jgi:hypothetical protein
MIRTLAVSALAGMGMMLLPIQTTPLTAAPTIAPKIPTPDSAVEQVRRRGGGFRGGGRSFRGGGRSYSRGFSRGRSYGRSYRGGRRFYGGRSYGRRYGGRRYGHRHYRHRHYRRGYIYGGLPLIYGGLYYNSCNYYYRKWKRTGSRYWRKRYYSCRW